MLDLEMQYNTVCESDDAFARQPGFLKQSHIATIYCSGLFSSNLLISTQSPVHHYDDSGLKVVGRQNIGPNSDRVYKACKLNCFLAEMHPGTRDTTSSQTLKSRHYRGMWCAKFLAQAILSALTATAFARCH
jgi:hypothetical protein